MHRFLAWQRLLAVGAVAAFLLSSTLGGRGDYALAVAGPGHACSCDCGCPDDDEAPPASDHAAAPPRADHHQSHCPFCPCCPGGCCWCSIAKAPCPPAAPTLLALAPTCLGQRPSEGAPHLPAGHPGTLLRPPRA